MTHFNYAISSVIICLSIVTLTLSTPIMVSFGTSKGPIIPKSAYTTHPTFHPRTDVPSKPAPVYEIPEEDSPNPSTYKPPIPHQYRTKLLAVKPSPNLILGTPLDVKYTPSVEKYEIYQKTQQNSIGKSYVGPNLFEKQPYEYDLTNRKTFLEPSVSYIKPQIYENKLNTVPEIGVVYSSGVRYYVPQIFYILSTGTETKPEHENSVYETNDRKYFYKT